MPPLILSPRYSDDSIKLRRAAIALGWDVMRLASWRCPDDFEPEEPVLYAEPLFNEAVAREQCERFGAVERDFSSPTRWLIIVVSRHTRGKGNDHGQAQTQPTAKARGGPTATAR